MVVFGILFSVFAYNSLGTAPQDSFRTWQQDSEALVLNRIEADRTDATGSHYGLLRGPRGQFSAFDFIDKPNVPTSAIRVGQYPNYTSSLGLQGWLWTSLYSAQGPINSLYRLHLLNASLLAATLTFLAILLSRVGRPVFAAVFLVTIAGSPWMVEAGQNLYWMVWTWFLPPCTALLFVIAKTRRTAIMTWIATALAFAVRFACGYEFISTLALAAAFMPVLALWLRKVDLTPRGAWVKSLLLLGSSVAGFALAVIPHGFLRGRGLLFSGLNQIVQQDVFRRTYGDAANFEGFDPVILESLHASPFLVLRTYLFGFPGNFESVGYGAPFTWNFGPFSLFALILSSIGVILWQAYSGDARWRRSGAALAFALLIPISWFVLGKAHSYVHPHINFILWYMFLPTVLFWITGGAILGGLRRLPTWNLKSTRASSDD
jgi:hypothetical protein